MRTSRILVTRRDLRPFTALAAAAAVACAAGAGAAGCGPPAADAGDAGTDAAEPLPSVCGNGVTEAAEECDDGNTTSGDGCNVSCLDEGPGVACGNGWVELGESCDDGNTAAGDGCDASCQIEPTVCPPAVDVACGTEVAGDSASGVAARDDYCALAEGDWTGPELLYRFDAATTEEVVFSLDPIAPLGGPRPALGLAIVPDDCAGIACAASALDGAPLPAGAPPAAAVLAAVAGTSYFVFVDGFAGAAGAFALTVGCATGAVCGNGVREGGEGCDDGNGLDGDGCNSACAVEAPPAECAAAAPSSSAGDRLDVGAGPVRVRIDTALETNDLTASCAALPGCGAGPDAVLELHLAAGVTDLEVTFDQGTGDHVLAVAHAAPTCVELACADPFPLAAGVQLFAGVATGGGGPGVPAATVWLVVDACSGATAGPVTLELRGL
jgi:cysteine-rich repeat protein